MSPLTLQPTNRPLAFACFALAAAVALACLIWPMLLPRTYSYIECAGVSLFLVAPLLGATVGFGCGVLAGTRGRYALFGYLLAVVFASCSMGGWFLSGYLLGQS